MIQVIDSLEHEQKFEWVQLDSIGKNFLLRHAWKPEGTYKLTIDSASISSLYGNVNKTLSTEFKIKSLEEYSTLGIVLESPDSLAMVQVLDSKDAVVRSLKAVDGKAVFEYLKPGDYFVRLYIDRNGNGQWDPGDLTLRLPPEDVYYFPKKLSLRANWEVEEPWNHLDPSYLNKKPEELKPAKKK